MTTQDKLSQGGLPSATLAISLAGGDMGSALAAAGTTLATATPIVNDIAIFTTVAAGAGARLPNSGSAYITVFNNSANALLVYPPTAAGVVNAGAAGAGFSVAAGKSSVFATPDGKTWVATHSA